MNQPLIIMVVAVAFIILYLYRIRSLKGGGKRVKRTLWQECRRKLQLPPKVADETIERYIKSLEKSHPDHPEEWYLEKIIYDLDRDRR